MCSFYPRQFRRVGVGGVYWPIGHKDLYSRSMQDIRTPVRYCSTDYFQDFTSSLTTQVDIAFIDTVCVTRVVYEQIVVTKRR